MKHKFLAALAAVVIAAGVLVVAAHSNLPGGSASPPGGTPASPGPVCQDGFLPIEVAQGQAQFAFSHALRLQWPVDRVPRGLSLNFFNCVDETSFGFQDRGFGTDTLYVYDSATGKTTEYDLPRGTLYSGIPPAQAQPKNGPRITRPLAPPPVLRYTAGPDKDQRVRIAVRPASSISPGNETLVATACKTVNGTYVYAYHCFHRYDFSESDTNFNYNTVWETGSTRGLKYPDSTCANSPDYRCMKRIKDAFRIDQSWCGSSTNCAIVGWKPASCCFQNTDADTASASLSISVGGFSTTLTSSWKTYKYGWGLFDIQWWHHVHAWASSSCVINDCYTTGRGNDIWVETGGGGYFKWRVGNGQLYPTYSTNVEDTYGFWNA